MEHLVKLLKQYKQQLINNISKKSVVFCWQWTGSDNITARPATVYEKPNRINPNIQLTASTCSHRYGTGSPVEP